MNTSRIVLFAHGSMDPSWTGTFERIAQTMKSAMGEDRVRLAYLQFATPTLSQVATEAVLDGVQNLYVLPLFLSSGGHVARDLPSIIVSARRSHPKLNIEVMMPVGEDARFATLVGTLIWEVLEREQLTGAGTGLMPGASA
jgi:sirohydrochlorin cobaltochelatase